MADKVKEFDSDYLKEKEQNDEKTETNSIFNIWCFVIHHHFNLDLYVYTLK